ncbi:MAG: YggS family pyridoxal phosphate enzyme, partial [Buchnera aphidicola]|nr:YggS family pyridoxal phosphate enzyme [Buchnera aphidicola]
MKHAILLGQKHFGENYIQESINKIQELEKFTEITWHFIGKVQSKKAKQVAQNFSWCQSIDREKIAILLNQYRPIKLPKLNVLIQINFFNDTKKNGTHIEECD